MSVLSRRRTSPAPLAKVFRAWARLRLAIKLTRFFMRVRRLQRLLLYAALAGLALAIVRRLRSRGADVRSTQPSGPSPSTAQDWNPATREAGIAAEPGTQTERNLEAEKTGGEPPAPTTT